MSAESEVASGSDTK